MGSALADSDRILGPPILFIGGSGRSGTNVMKALLARHSQVSALPFEHRFLIDPDGIVDFYASYSASWSPYMADRRLKRLERFLRQMQGEGLWHRLAGRLLRRLNPDGRLITPRRYHGWRLGAHFPGFETEVNHLLSELRHFIFPAAWVGSESYTLRPTVQHGPPRTREELAPPLGHFLNKVVSAHLRAAGKRLFVEDNTWNILFARELLELAPQARLLHIYRDPRDVVASLVAQRWSPHTPLQAAVWYRDIMRRWLAVRAELAQEAYLEVSLEALVEQTEETVRGICAFVSLPVEPALFQMDLSRSHRGRWRQDFSEREQAQVEEIVGDFVTRFGYR